MKAEVDLHDTQGAPLGSVREANAVYSTEPPVDREALARADRAIEAAPDSAPGYPRRARAKYYLADEEGALADAD